MTEKTKATGQRVASNDTDKSMTDLINSYKFKFLTKKSFSTNDNEYSVYHTFKVEPGRFDEYNKSTMLFKEAIKIGVMLRKHEDAILNIAEQFAKSLSDDERRQILDDDDSFAISSDSSLIISVYKEWKFEHSRLDSQAKGLLYEKLEIDDRLRGKVLAAYEVLCALLDKKRVYDKNGQTLNYREVERWLRMHGRPV